VIFCHYFFNLVAQELGDKSIWILWRLHSRLLFGISPDPYNFLLRPFPGGKIADLRRLPLVMCGTVQKESQDGGGAPWLSGKRVSTLPIENKCLQIAHTCIDFSELVKGDFEGDELGDEYT